MMPLLLALLAQAVTPPMVSAAPRIIAPAAALAQPDGLEPLGRNDPPVELIDFLGRRYECAHRGVPRAEQARLRCASLHGEEQGWRTRFANDDGALRWLDQAPLSFRMDRRLVATLISSEPTTPHRLEQTGVDDGGRPYRLTIDAREDAGHATRISVTYAGWPARSFTLRHREFPLLDLNTLQASTIPAPNDRFFVMLSYGHPRRYCGEDGDSRESVRVVFLPTEVRGDAMRRTNCQRLYEPVTDAAAR